MSLAEEHSLGVGPHKDYGFLALLLQDTTGGLQVQNEAGDWIDAPPIPGAFVVNIGEMLELASHGAFTATTHRVLVPTSSRLSIPFFYNPSFTAQIMPVPSLPSDLADLARTQAADHEGVDLFVRGAANMYGDNALRGYLRSQRVVFEKHHPELLTEPPQALSRL